MLCLPICGREHEHSEQTLAGQWLGGVRNFVSNNFDRQTMVWWKSSDAKEQRFGPRNEAHAISAFVLPKKKVSLCSCIQPLIVYTSSGAASISTQHGPNESYFDPTVKFL